MSSAQPQQYNEIVAGLKRVERRLRWQEAARLAPMAAAGALVAGVALGVAGRIWPILPPVQMILVALGLLLLALLGAVLYALLRPRPRLMTARQGDLALELDERLATAVEEQEQKREVRLTPQDAVSYNRLRAEQIADTAATLNDALPELPARLPLAPRWQVVALPVVLAAVLGLALFAPNPIDAIFQQREAVQQQQQEEADKIEEIQKAIATLPQDATVQQLSDELQSLQDALESGDMSQEEALARLSEAEAQLQQLQDKQAPAEQAALDSLARQLSEQPGKLGDAGKSLQQGDSEKAAEQIAQAAQDLDKMTPEERAAMAQALRDAAAELANNDPALAQRLNDAAQALQSGDNQASQQALDNLADEVRQSGQNLATQEQIDRALSQIQESKGNIASAGANGTPIAGGTPLAGTPLAANGTPINGTPISFSGTPISGTMMASNGTPVTGTLSLTGTPVIMPGQGTPVAGNGNGQGQGQGQGNSNGNGAGAGNGAGTGHQEPVAVPPSTLNAQGTPVGVQARPGQGDTSTTGVNTNPAGGTSSVPYSDVYGSYSQGAEQTLEGDYIPAGMKDLVRRYFTAIDPGQ